MIFLLWAAEFLLESSGAYFAYRKRIKILSALLAFRAGMDVLTFAIFILHLHPAYGFTMWAGRAIQYALLYALGLQLAARMIEDYRPLTQYVYKTLAIGASVATYVFVSTELWERKFAHAEAITGFLLIAVVGVGWIGRKKGLEEPWRTIACGLTVSASGNALCAAFSASFSGAMKFYPIPAILALLIWNLSVWPKRKKAVKLSEFRGGADLTKIPPAGVYREISRSVM